jgi:cyclopropane-fatty-acyl-phospholipid synthase
MKGDQSKTAARAKSITLGILDELLPKDPGIGVGVRLWDGSHWPDVQPRAATIVLNHPGALKSMFAGMFEHLGANLLETYFKKAMEMLRPGGVFLNHGIASNATIETRRGPTFTQRYVFPDGGLIPINVLLNIAELAGFEVRDVESLREHYALTLRHWVRRLEAHHLQALDFISEPTYRIWRLFMSASAYGFATGRMNVYQSLLVKQDQDGSSNLPLTRADWYE